MISGRRLKKVLERCLCGVINTIVDIVLSVVLHHDLISSIQIKQQWACSPLFLKFRPSTFKQWGDILLQIFQKIISFMNIDGCILPQSDTYVNRYPTKMLRNYFKIRGLYFPSDCRCKIEPWYKSIRQKEIFYWY